MLERTLPDGVAAAESFDDPPEAAAGLFPEEAAVVAKAVEKRRREFATARLCARRALAELGVPPVPLVPGERGAPSWPDGIVGSMTHCEGYRAAAVARSQRFASVGVDAEPNLTLPEGVGELVMSEVERTMTETLAKQSPDVHWDRLLFCAKEAVYKTWFPLTRRWLGFDEAAVEISLDGGFSAELLVPGPIVDGRGITGFTGRWTADEKLMIVAIALPR